MGGRHGLDERRFRQALATLRHRGPDAENIQRFSSDAILGHTRLSIIDLHEASNQPLSVLGRYWIIYNGEIYNYIELREELEGKGIQFRTQGDTEVLLYAYAVWGEDCISRFNGMWAFAIYDTREKTLFCSRDRFGVKPFNYVIDKGQFLFASEVKAILAYRPELAQPEYNAIANYCRTSVGAQSEQTWFRNILRLPPGGNLTIRNGQIRTQRYWRYPNGVDQKISFGEAKEQYAELFRDAVRLRMRSDVPLGLTLSSGIDSSSIAYMMHAVDANPHHCFTSRFIPQDGLQTDTSIYAEEADIDESISAVKVAGELGLHSHVVDTDYAGFVPFLEHVIYHLESGHSSPAVIPLMQLLARAREHVTVLLDGQGADELLGGYILNTLSPAIMDLATKGRFADALHSLRRFSAAYKLSYAAQMALRDLSNDLHFLSRAHQRLSGVDQVYGPVLRGYRRHKDYRELPGEGNRSRLGRHLMRRHAGGLVNLLHYGDAISMANSIESRMPFLDYRLVEFTWGLPSEFKVHLATGKYVHREAMRGKVPNRILDQKIKFGFNTPINQQFRAMKPSDASPIDVLLDNRCLARGLFDRPGLEALISEHRSEKRDHGTLLFRLLSTELWFRCFVDAPVLANDQKPAHPVSKHVDGDDTVEAMEASI